MVDKLAQAAGDKLLKIPTNLEELGRSLRTLQTVCWWRHRTDTLCQSALRSLRFSRPNSSDRNGLFRREDIVVERRLACRPCYERDKCPLEHWQCILDIAVDHVYEACRKRLPLTPAHHDSQDLARTA